jgi:hypothetical protein
MEKKISIRLDKKLEIFEKHCFEVQGNTHG